MNLAQRAFVEKYLEASFALKKAKVDYEYQKTQVYENSEDQEYWLEKAKSKILDAEYTKRQCYKALRDATIHKYKVDEEIETLLKSID